MCWECRNSTICDRLIFANFPWYACRMMLFTSSSRQGFGLKLVLNLLWLSAAAWYFLISPEEPALTVHAPDGRTIDTLADAKAASQDISAQADDLNALVARRAAERMAEAEAHPPVVETPELPEAQQDLGGVVVRRGLPAVESGGRRVIRVAPEG